MMTALVVPWLIIAGCGAPQPAAAAAPDARDTPPAAPAPRPPATQPAAPRADGAAGGTSDGSADASADDLLRRAEAGGDGLRDISAQLTYWKTDALLDKTEIRQGQVLYQVRPDGTRRLAILLEREIVNQRARRRQEHYVFDGSWLVEIDHDSKQFIKRQIVPPGKTFDPLKLGEGPFPLPIGQPADEVKARFETSRLDAPLDETLAARLAGRNVEGVLLVPRAGTAEAEDFTRVEIFYDPASMLPVGIGVVETSGDTRTVLLTDVKRNAGIDEKKLDITEPDPREWQIDVRPWKG